jgi:hypothetical protein
MTGRYLGQMSHVLRVACKDCAVYKFSINLTMLHHVSYCCFYGLDASFIILKRGHHVSNLTLLPSSGKNAYVVGVIEGVNSSRWRN